MKLIKIVNGTYGFRPDSNSIELKTADDAPFEVDDKEADRLVNLGVAIVAFGEDSKQLQHAIGGVIDELEGKPIPPADDVEIDEFDNGDDEGAEERPQEINPADLKKMTVPQLVALAEEFGLQFSNRAKKTELINAISEASAEGDELPEVEAADPEDKV